MTMSKEEAEKIVQAAVLLDQDETPVMSRQYLGSVSAARRAAWASRLDADDDELLAVQCQGGRGILEHAVSPTTGEAVLLDCRVSFEDLPPSCLVEYKFDSDNNWRLSMVCLDYLLAFRAGKFKDWETRMLNPSCAAEFRRMVQIGPVFKVFDHHMFPSPEAEMEQFQVVDESSGKTVILPRPVSDLRIWNTETQSYDPVDATLDGTPEPSQREEYWKGLVEKLRVQYPEEVENVLGR